MAALHLADGAGPYTLEESAQLQYLGRTGLKAHGSALPGWLRCGVHDDDGGTCPARILGYVS
jgi:hypothetical protein